MQTGPLQVSWETMDNPRDRAAYLNAVNNVATEQLCIYRMAMLAMVRAPEYMGTGPAITHGADTTDTITSPAGHPPTEFSRPPCLTSAESHGFPSS